MDCEDERHLTGPEIHEGDALAADASNGTRKHGNAEAGGHMGVIIGSRAQDAVWAQSVAWLEKRSARAAGKTRRRPSAKLAKAPRRKKSTESGAGNTGKK